MRLTALSVFLAVVPAVNAAAPAVPWEKINGLLSADEANMEQQLKGLFDGQAAGQDFVAPPRQDRKTSMLVTLDFVRTVFKARYAPAGWKGRYAGWDLDREIDAAKKDIQDAQTVSVKDFQKLLHRVINSTKDYHVSVRFDSSESASLPFKVVGAGGRYFIAWVDREKLPESSFPFQVGDELLRFGAGSAADAVRELQKFMGQNAEKTDQALAALYLTSRRGAAGLDVPVEPVTIAVKRRDTGATATHQLAWDYSPELVSEPDPRFSLMAADGVPGFKARMDDMLSPVPTALLDSLEENPFAIGGRKSYVPALGEKIWESEAGEPFYAYLYRTDKGRVVGYVRIPSYSPQDVDKAVKQFGTLMAKFDKTTDALVIDQVNNPGGGVFYLYTLASMLSERALQAPKHRVAIAQSDVAGAARILGLEREVKNDADAKKALGNDINGYPVSYQMFRYFIGYARFIIQEWNAGRTLTAPTYLYGVDLINPSTVARYTKPILLLINELDFSGGDFFPAILQDNGRAKIFGTRTAGAGGFVNSVNFPNVLGIQLFSVTGSIAERADGNPIENLGVKPDIEYDLAATDLEKGFKGYAQAIGEAVDGLLKTEK